MKSLFTAVGLILALAACSATSAQRQACYGEAAARWTATEVHAQCPGAVEHGGAAWTSCPAHDALMASLAKEQAACP